MKKTYTILAIICFASFAQANQPHKTSNENLLFSNYNSRSDTLDILDYKISLSINDFVNKTISGNCEIKSVVKLNNTASIIFDLQQLIVDSIIINGVLNSNFSQANDFLKINFAQPFSQNDSVTFQIFYHGAPFAITNGFGGFYFSNNIAYNMGVGIGVAPPNFGRVWFPCFDNFIERSTYEFFITTKITHKAFCNGMLQNVITDSLNQQKIWHYKLTQTIPTYLACVAVGAYATVHQTFSSLTGNMPVELGALPTDTTLLKTCFTNLENAFDIFEEAFGPYRWPRVGYTLVPFNSGAMEHATNISYPRPFVDNAGTYEAELMAHELSHHWFGDLVTCDNAKDMWLNEGWATFAGLLFLEKVHDTTTYIAAVKSKLDDVVHFANYKEGGYQTLSNMPDNYTYGTHVYDKGSLVAHSMRAYLGNLFFSSLTQYMNNNNYKPTNSIYFRDQLELYSGKNLHSFFDNFVFDAGFSHFSVDSFKVQNNSGNFAPTVYIKQKLIGTSNLYNKVPLDFTFYDANNNSITLTDTVNAGTSIHQFNLPFNAKYVLANQTQRLATAQILEQKRITSTGTNAFGLSKLTTTVNTFTDTIFLNVEHNYVHPDGFNTATKYRLSPNRYWKISGIIPTGSVIKGTFKYNGRTLATTGDNYLDNLLINETEDSLFLFHRESAATEWAMVTDTTWSRGNKNDKVGTLYISNLKIGEYTWAMKDEFAGINTVIGEEKIDVFVYPNPANSTITIDASPTYKTIDFINISGQLVNSVTINKSIDEYDISKLQKGIYFLRFIGEDKTCVLKFVKE